MVWGGVLFLSDRYLLIEDVSSHLLVRSEKGRQPTKRSRPTPHLSRDNDFFNLMLVLLVFERQLRRFLMC